MKKISFIFLLISCQLASQGYAQTRVLRLEESKQSAVEYSMILKNSELQIESAKADIMSAKSAYYPSISLNGVGIYGFKDLVGAIPPLLEQSVGNLYLFSAGATQPIYVGGKIKVGNQLAALQLEVARIRAKQSTDSVLLVTEQKYWNLVNFQEQTKVIHANEKMLDAILKQQNDMLTSGLIARNDMLKVKVQRSKLLLNKTKLESGHKLALLDFCMYTGVAFSDSLLMQDTLAGVEKTPLLLAPDISLEVNSTYVLIKKRLESEKLKTKLARGEYLPTVSIGVNAAQFGGISNGLGSKFIPISMATVQVPISDWWGKGKQKLKQRQLSEQIAQNQFKDVESQLLVGITKAWYDMSDALKEIGFAQENFQQAQENLKVSQDNYASGLVGITELIDAQALYQQANSELVNSLANFRSKQASYYFLTGKHTN
ncbi:TolC family protein [Dyadobacter psychrotolerans]|uniref:TolC family protein n=1 Tax=Dyadobacter psychrotolerans TaxID=2541721 RepID=A0A4R5DDR6_9BACT|nr:TolC family protein [Dyadobacter psychrotolerans]TDE08715.1 TolC family protein [Dyadobacter psychrotolerans]